VLKRPPGRLTLPATGATLHSSAARAAAAPPRPWLPPNTFPRRLASMRTRTPLTTPSARHLGLALLGLGVLLAPWLLAADEAAPPGVVATLKGHTEALYAVAFTPDGQYVVTGSFDKTLKVWDAATGKEFKTFGGPAGHQGLV